MKKKPGKIVLSKETLNRLDATMAVGGATALTGATRCPITYCDNCGPDDTGICTWPGKLC